MKALIPRSPDEPGGPFVTAGEESFDVRAASGGVVIIEFHSLPEGVPWLEDVELLYCRRQDDPDTVKVMREATDEERKLYRIPRWIQVEEVPECCGRPMHFVGQIDDNHLCAQPPRGAELWWHDGASFYVFTCSKCLGCKAVGQQY